MAGFIFYLDFLGLGWITLGNAMGLKLDLKSSFRCFYAKNGFVLG